MFIYLIRHGQKEKQIINPPLTLIGQKEAKLTGEYFKNITIEKIFSSPLIRTMETATIISKTLDMNFETDPLLQERFDWGDTPGQTFSEFITDWRKASQIRNWKPENGFSSIEAGQRMQKFIDQINKNYKNIIIISHGGIIVDFLRNNFEDKELNQVYPNFSNYYEEVIQTCSITKLLKQNNKYKIISIGDIDHLK